MKNWNTTLNINTEEDQIETSKISINRGIFQGDSFSALWFCLALNPISRTLNTTNYGFKLKANERHQLIKHLLYMDDLKVYASTKSHIESLLKLVHKLSSDIFMTFGVDKCQVVSIIKGKLSHGDPTSLDENTEISPMEDTPYKYLGMLQSNRIEHAQIKEDLTRKFEMKLNSLLKTKLNASNLTKAINSYAIPTLEYSFGIIKWTTTELENINRLIRTRMNKFRMHHLRASTERVTMPRNQGGRGLKDLASACSA